MHAGIGRGQRLEHGFFHRQVRQVRGRHQRLMFMRRRGHDVDVSLQARTNALLRAAESGAAVQREMLRQHVQQRAVALQANVGGQFDGVFQIARIQFMRAPEFVQAAALRAAHFHAADADGDGIHRNLRAALGVGHCRANRFGHGHRIAHAALRPARRRRQAMRQIANPAVLNRADDAARAGAARVQTDGQLDFRAHAPSFCSTTVMRSSRRRSSELRSGIFSRISA